MRRRGLAGAGVLADPLFPPNISVRECAGAWKSERREVRIRVSTGVGVLVCALAALPQVCSGATWSILFDGTGDAPTIQAGIDSAASGDTLLVGPGIYNENINLLTKELVIKSTSGPDATVINGDPRASNFRGNLTASAFSPGTSNVALTHPTGTVVSIEGGQSQRTLVEGFTIQGGGLGVAVWYASPRIVKNRIVHNAGPNGGGVTCIGTAKCQVEGNTIQFNSTTFALGAGVYFGDAGFELVDNYIANNETKYADGGGVAIIYPHEGSIIEGNVFVVPSRELLKKGKGVFSG